MQAGMAMDVCHIASSYRCTLRDSRSVDLSREGNGEREDVGSEDEDG